MKKFQGFLLLCLLGFSVGLMLFLPFEIFRTLDTQGWQPVEVVVSSHKIETLRGRYYPQIEIRETETGEVSRAVHIRYGDIALSLNLLGYLSKSTLYGDRDKYPSGSKVIAYKNDLGSEYVLERNSISGMLCLFVLSCIYPLIALHSVFRSKKSNKTVAARS